MNGNEMLANRYLDLSARIAALEAENARLVAGLDHHAVRDSRIAQTIAALQSLESAMQAEYSQGAESLFKTWALHLGCAITALQTPGQRGVPSSNDIAIALGLPADAEPDAVLAAVKRLRVFVDDVGPLFIRDVARELGLPDDTLPDDVMAALQNMVNPI